MLTVFSKEACPACVQLVNLLKARGYEFEVKKLDADYTRENLAEMFESKGLVQPRSFPILFKDEVLVGGLIEAKMAVAKNTL